jgi:beta-lactamase class A
MNQLQLLSCLLILSLYPALSFEAAVDYPKLRDSLDEQLQSGVQKSLNRLGLEDAIARKQLSVVLADITDIRHPKVASLNGDEMMYAASLPKIAILLGAFVQIERGQLVLNRTIRRTLTSMIRVSSNEAATQMFRIVGPRQIADILQAPQYRLYDPDKYGGIWCGKEYKKGRLWRRDPINKLSHAATALQTARFYYLLETGRLVSPRLTHVMKEMLSRSGLHHKFVKGLKHQPGIKIYRKSGTWKQWHADSALVEHGRYKYIVVALARHPKGGQWLTQLISPLHELIVPAQLAVALPK